MASAARENFRTDVGTIYTLVATSHLESLANALGTPNLELSIASVSMYARCLVVLPCFLLRTEHVSNHLESLAWCM